MMRRRDFITLLGGAAAAWPLAVRAQQPMMPVIGYLFGQLPEPAAGRLSAFREGLGQLGYIEGQNVAIEYRWAEGDNERLPSLMADLIQRRVNVIVTAGGTPAAKAAQAATSTIPIVFLVGADPIADGLVASLNRPGGNITGIVDFTGELVPKHLELLREIVPGASGFAVLVNPTNPVFREDVSNRIKPAADALGLQLQFLTAVTEGDFEEVFAALRRSGAGGLVITGDQFFAAHAEQLAAFALRHATPAIMTYSDFAVAGGLMTYGPSRPEMFRQLGLYAGRILRGDRAADLPVQQATKVRLTLNLRTAKALRLTVPPNLLATADEVIE
jgi:putative ABC transport system substrate-binding protein